MGDKLKLEDVMECIRTEVVVYNPKISQFRVLLGHWVLKLVAKIRGGRVVMRTAD